MPRTAPFEALPERYDAWFADHPAVYASEVAALERHWPGGTGLEIGVGSGRFAAPLGVDVGLDPAPAMLRRARDRGIAPVQGVAEALPFRAGAFDAAVLVTTICFVDDVAATFAEAARVLRSEGRLLVGFVDAESALGRRYQAAEDNPFYRDATFLSTAEVTAALERAGYTDLAFAQTLFGDSLDRAEPASVRAGTGDGSFVVVAATPPG